MCRRLTEPSKASEGKHKFTSKYTSLAIKPEEFEQLVDMLLEQGNLISIGIALKGYSRILRLRMLELLRSLTG